MGGERRKEERIRREKERDGRTEWVCGQGNDGITMDIHDSTVSISISIVHTLVQSLVISRKKRKYTKTHKSNNQSSSIINIQNSMM